MPLPLLLPASGEKEGPVQRGEGRRATGLGSPGEENR